jgi:hypothetical protein
MLNGDGNVIYLPIASRRDAALAASLPDGTGPDAELIEVCARFYDLLAEIAAAYDRHARDGQDIIDAVVGPLADKQGPLLESMLALRAETLAGYRARAFVLRRYTGPFNSEGDWTEQMAGALVRDLIEVPRSRATFAVDASMIELCGKFIKLEVRKRALFETMEDDEARMLAIDVFERQQESLVDSIAELHPVSFEGHRARVRALATFSGEQFLGDIDSSMWDERLKAAILRDMAAG